MDGAVEGSVAAFSIGEDVAGRIRASVRNKMKVAGFDKQGNKLSIQQVDTQIMRLLNAELRAMGMNTLPLKLENVPVSTLNQLDNRILPVLDMIADIYVANRGVREAELLGW